MADPRQKLEAEKAKILADAQKAAAEIDQDIRKIDELEVVAAKYGLRLVEQNGSEASKAAFADARDSSGGAVIKSASRRAVEEAEKIIRAKGAPVPLSKLYNSIEQRGIKIGGTRPLSTLSAYLSQSENLESIRKGWWWLKGVPVPKHGHSTEGEKLPCGA